MFRLLAHTPRYPSRYLNIPSSRTCLGAILSSELIPRVQQASVPATREQARKYHNSESSFDQSRLPQTPPGVSLSDWSLRVDIDPSNSISGVTWNLIELRDACSCVACRDPHSKQKRFRTSDIPANIRVSNIRQLGDTLAVQWENDIPGYEKQHTSVYTTENLQDSRPGSKTPYSLYTERSLWNGMIMEDKQYWVTYDDYMNNDVKLARALRNLQLYGLIFIENVPDSREMVAKLATRIGPLQNTFYGLTWDVRSVPEAKNVAYTNQHLGFHMDLLYMGDVPKLQFLHCLKNSCEGGESIFADAIQAAQILAETDPAAFSTLSKFIVPYQYVHSDNIYYRGRSIIQSGESPNGPNKPVIQRVSYSPPFQGRWAVANQGYGSAKRRHNYLLSFHDALKKFDRELDDKSAHFELKMQPGTCVVFDNHRIVHARRAFNTSSGERWLAGAYLANAPFKSKMRVVRRYHPEVFR